MNSLISSVIGKLTGQARQVVLLPRFYLQLLVPVVLARDDVQSIDAWIPRGDEADITIIDADGTETGLDGTVQQTTACAFRADPRDDQFDGDVNLRVAGAATRKIEKRLMVKRV